MWGQQHRDRQATAEGTELSGQPGSDPRRDTKRLHKDEKNKPAAARRSHPGTLAMTLMEINRCVAGLSNRMADDKSSFVKQKTMMKNFFTSNTERKSWKGPFGLEVTKSRVEEKAHKLQCPFHRNPERETNL